MPSQNIISIILNAVDKTGSASKSATGNLQKIKSAVGTLAGGAAALTGALAVVGGTMKAAFALGEEGAQILQTSESFDLLLQKVKAAPDLLDQLRRASKGTIDDQSLMASTATLLAGAQGDLATALAQSTPKLMEIAKAAQKLNPALGDTNFLYQSLATGVKRASPMILDNLGLTIKIGDANEKYAKALGKTVPELTAEEQKMALLNATLDAGNALIEQVGGNTDSATDAFARLNASTTNLANNAKTKLVPILANAAEALDLLSKRNGLIADALAEHTKEVIKNSASYDDYVKEILRADAAAGKFNAKYMELYTTEVMTGRATGDLMDRLGLLNEEQFKGAQLAAKMADGDAELATRLKQVGYGFDAAARSAGKLTLSEEELQKIQDKLKAQLSDLDFLVGGKIGPEFKDFTQKQDDLKTKAGELTKKIAELGGTEYLTPEQASQIKELQNNLNGVVGHINDLNDKIKSGDFGKNKLKAAKVEVKDLQEEAYKLELKIKKLGGAPYTTKKQQEELDQARKDLEEVNSALDENAKAHEDATKRILFSMLEQQAASDGLTQNEVTNLTNIAEQWGIVDTQTATAMRAINGSLDSLDTTNPNALLAILEKIYGLPSTKTFTYTVKTNYIGKPPSQGTTGRASGGPVTAGVPYWVGERGIPELFVPNRSGTIIPKSKVPSGAGGVVYNDYSQTINQNPAAAAMNENIRRMYKRRRFNELMGVA